MGKTYVRKAVTAEKSVKNLYTCRKCKYQTYDKVELKRHACNDPRNKNAGK